MHRREFMNSALAGIASAKGLFGPVTTPLGAPDWRAAFPALSQQINGHPLTYLDTAATSLRPQSVIDALAHFYSTDNANPGEKLHTLARRAHIALESSRAAVASFIGAREAMEVVFTRGTTEALNLVAATWGAANVRAGDEILIGIAEHSSNMLPWRFLANRVGAQLRYFDIDDDGRPRLEDIERQLTSRTRIVAFSHVSNVLGMINPAREICESVRAPGRIVVIDGAQSVPHIAVSVADLGCDFFAFSSHKMLGPMGVGVLWGRRELLDAMPPYQSGSNMAHDVDLNQAHLSTAALKFGAGTPNVCGPVGLAAAIAFLKQVGHVAMREHEVLINTLMFERLSHIRQVRVLGSNDARERVSVFSLAVDGVPPAEVLSRLDTAGIAIRAGDLASLPLLKRLGVASAARASCYLYTSHADIDRFAEALQRATRG